MNEKYLLDKSTSWVQNLPWLMFLGGVLSLITLLDEFTRYQAAACLVSGIINIVTGLGSRYKRVTIGKIITFGSLLFFVGFWSVLIGFVNLDGDTALLLPYTTFVNGVAAVLSFLLFKFIKL
jgi:hypothetical protein